MTTLLALVEALITDPGAKEAYLAEPGGFLDRHGFGALDPEDVSEAVTHAAAVLPPAVAVQLTPEDGFDTLTGVAVGPLDDGPAAHDALFPGDGASAGGFGHEVDFDRTEQTADTSRGTDDDAAADADAGPRTTPADDEQPDATAATPEEVEESADSSGLTSLTTIASDPGSWFEQDAASFTGFDEPGIDEPDSDILDDVDTLDDHPDA